MHCAVHCLQWRESWSATGECDSHSRLRLQLATASTLRDCGLINVAAHSKACGGAAPENCPAAATAAGISGTAATANISAPMALLFPRIRNCRFFGQIRSPSAFSIDPNP